MTVDFTAGIAVIIAASQLKELPRLRLSASEPGPIVEKIPALWQALPSASVEAIALAVDTVCVIAGLKRLRPH